jgi:hypothetical protein
MNPQSMQLLQALGVLGGNELDNAVSGMLKAKTEEIRIGIATKAQEANITDPKMVKYIFTGKYE